MVNSGHEVTLVTRDLNGTSALFPPHTVRCLPAPIQMPAGHRSIPNPVTLAQLAWNLVFHNEDQSADSIRSWRDIFRLVEPDLLIADFGLMSLAVAKSLGVPSVRIGNGYLCPPSGDSPALFDLFLEEQLDKEALDDIEKASRCIISAIGKALCKVGLKRQPSWRDLLLPVERTVLITIPALDPYQNQRENDATYLGFWDRCGGRDAVWSGTAEIKAFAYLKPFAGLKSLLTELTSCNVATALVIDGDANLEPSIQTTHPIQLQDGMVDISTLTKECRFAICNGNHGTVCRLLTAGIPILSAPLFLEHRITSAAVHRYGCGLSIRPNTPGNYYAAVSRICSDEKYRANANQFASENRHYGEGAYERAIAQLETFLGHQSGDAFH
ncbi:glycosyltransferase [Rubripirellula obstinata]|uniref:glycosyltransferase n=1 Tax=Rubripirellula obstinata TaxID=406547 RepID=UPI001F2D086B|nr:nucleotide disphospho-sugar-binding domain-containing protein [Rubripirellula obstinata]